MLTLRPAFALLLLVLASQARAQTCPANNPLVAPDSRYTVSEPGPVGERVVQDLRTGLMWKKCVQGRSGALCGTGSDSALIWTAALTEANNESFAGHSDWRLPSVNELRSLVETGCHSPALNTTVFPNTASALFWSSSTLASNTSAAWVVGFGDGVLNAGGKGIGQRVRLVRGGHSLDTFDSGLDFTPDQFSFLSQVDVPQNSERISNAIIVSGISTPVGIGVSGDASSAYSVNGGDFTSAPGAVIDGDSVVQRHVSAAAPLTAVTSTLRIGPLTADFVSTTGVPTHTVGGTLSGLAGGASVVLQNNGGDDLMLNADGSFTFATALDDLSAYAVTVFTQPTNPSQTCTVTSGSGSLAGANVTNVTVNCVTDTFTVGGTLSGLASGASVVLQNNDDDDLMLNAEGGFTFATALEDLSVYAVTVLTQPTGPSQTCMVTNGTGNLAGANVTNVVVDCVTNTFTVGGTLNGLASGASVVLRNNGGDDLSLNAEGGFTFATALEDLSAYAVTVLTQPTGPSQTCTVSNGSGNLAGANVTNVLVNCVTDTFTVSGTLNGLASGASVVLQNNTGDDLMLNAEGGFTFATALEDLSAYAVTVLTQPTGPSQTCMVTNGTGNLAGANVTNVVVDCVTNTFTVGGTLNGLASGASVVLRNNGGDDLTLNADSSFTFATALEDLSGYEVTVLTQPTGPSQTCTVTNGSGNLAGANVTNVTVSCVTNTFSVGGTLNGLAAGASVVLQNNGGDDLTLNADGSFTFATALEDLSAYAVTVLTQPTGPSQTCTVSNSSGNLAGANVTDVTVNCVTNTFTVGGTLSGLAAGASVVLQNNGDDDLTLNANGTFTFATALDDLSAYAVTVFTQPTNPSQTCTVTSGSGSLAGANVTNVTVNCVTDTFTVGGTLSGLASGASVVLQNNTGDDLMLNAEGGFTFATALEDLSAYAVTVLTQPTGPSQTCMVTNGTGNLAGANVTNVVVDCVTNTFTVGGTLNGLASGASVVLRNNGGDDLSLNAEGGFTFATALEDLSAYAVTVLTQPTGPSQTCTVSNGSGNLAGANVTNVLVNCVTDTFTVSGTLNGLASGASVVLRNNVGDDLSLNADGSFTFATALDDLSAYAVTVLSQPTGPSQTCTVTNGSGNLAGANVSNVVVDCVTDTFSVGGTLNGLAAGASVVLQNNTGDDLTLNADGSFTFATALDDLSAYAVTVLTQPTNPSQTCSVTNDSGNLAGANVSNVVVDCVTDTFSVGGTLNGLAAGASVVLQNNTGDDLTLNADGSFTFATALDDLSAYAVTVLSQPTGPSQTCTVTNGTGNLAGANVTNVSVNCVTDTFTVGVTLNGLASDASVVLQNNGDDDLTLNANGSFTFATALDDLSAYAVTVLSQPTNPSQTCTVSNGSGNLAGANVTNVSVNCVTDTFTVGGTLNGLASDASVVLQNNGDDDLTLNADGSFTFATALDDLSVYAVTVLTQPASPSQTCSVTNDSGNLAGANVTAVVVDCVTNPFTVGGTLNGLAAGASVVLQNNGGDDLTLNADGSFTFATALDDLSAYAVTVLTQPTGPSQTCTVANGTGNLAGANVSNVEVSCLTVVHTVTPSASSGGSIAPDSPQLVEDGQSISLTLSPDPDYSIAGVGGTCGGELLGTQFTTDPITQNCTVEADFVLNPLLGVVLVGSGEGQVVSEPPGIVCPGQCEQRFPPGTVLTLSASVDTTQASTGVRPLGWFGAECASGGPCTFALDADRSILAGFAGARRLSLQVFGNGADAPGQDRVSIPLTAPKRPANLGDTDFTIELWFKAKSGRNNAQVACSNGVDAWIEGNVLLDRDIFGAESDFGDYGLSLMDGRLAFGVSRGSEGVTLCGGSIVNNGRWYHLAITRSVATGELNMWLNGRHQASATGPAGDIRYRPDRPAPELWPADPYLVIGAEKHDSGEGFPSFAGWIMDLHLSGTRRYTTAFTPPSSVQADADSLAIYRFDEGDGPVMFDEAVQAGGPSHGLRHLGGEPAGPCWSDDVPTLGRIFRSGFELEGCQ